MAFAQDVPPLVGGMLSMLCSTLLYGINIVVFTTCLYLIVQRKFCGNKTPWFILCGAVMQFMVSSIHIGNGWRDLVVVFIENLQYPGGPAQFLATNPARTATIIAKVAVIANSFLADMILTWRLYMVWNRNLYICIAPMATMVTYVVLYSIGLSKLVKMHHESDLFSIAQWLVTGLGLSLATHASVTCLIAGRIWWAARNNSVYSGVTRHMMVVWMILESGAIYSLAVVFLVAFAIMKTRVGGFVSSIFTQLSGIIPTLIIVRVGLGLTSDQTSRGAQQTIQFQQTRDSESDMMSIVREPPVILRMPPIPEGMKWEESV